MVFGDSQESWRSRIESATSGLPGWGVLSVIWVGWHLFALHFLGFGKRLAGLREGKVEMNQVAVKSGCVLNLWKGEQSLGFPDWLVRPADAAPLLMGRSRRT